MGHTPAAKRCIAPSTGAVYHFSVRRRLFTLAIAMAPLALLAAAAGAQGPWPPVYFDDGFESGDTAEWALTAPQPPPPEVCARPIDDVDTSGATVVGSGTPQSCTQAALDAALAANNGMIRFACGAAPHTLTVTAEKVVTTSLVIDGGGLVTLSGGGTTRILALRPPFNPTPEPILTVQNLGFTGGYTGNLPGTNVDNGGAAIYRGMDGHLRVVDCTFTGNVGPALGQDVAGGAIYSRGDGTTTVVGSTFSGNRCSSGGALGNLFGDLTVVNSRLAGNAATGSGGNPGNGGNGGGIYVDGASQTVTLCGTRILGNDANAAGGGVFRVSNNGVGPMSIDRCVVSGNRIPAGTPSQAGGLYLQGLQLTITASTIARNLASSTGGIFVWTNPGSQTLAMTNVTVAENHARTGLGAGMTVANGVTGSLRHVTVARNSNEGPTSFASALAGGSGLTVANSLIADNVKVFPWEDVSCNVEHAGVGSIQWPDENAGGEPERPCAGVTFLDPAIGPLRNSGGPTPTLMPAAAALASAATTACAAADQRGVPRSQPCTPGAVEMP
jgi:hypothetical protein